MLQRVSSLIDRIRRSSVAIPVALLLAFFMVAVNELAYRGAQGRLAQLVDMGKARVALLTLVQHTSEAESGKRGYLLTGGREYLEPYQATIHELQRDSKRLLASYRAIGDEEALRRMVAVDEVLSAKVSEMEEVMRLHDAGKAEAALEVVRSGIGRDLMSRLHTRASELIAYQNQRIAGGLTEVFDTLLLNRVGIGTMTVVALMVLIMFVRLGQQLERQRHERAAAVQAERDRLEVEVQRRTAELTELARHLQTAREDERARLARDLHDELGALLTAAKLDVARLRPKLQQAAPELLDRLSHLTQSLNSGIALKRRIIEDLRPSTLSTLGLVPSLEILCSEFAERSGVPVRTDLHPATLGSSGDLTAFRLVQEALTNVAKYAQANQIHVRLLPDGPQARVEVVDDGCGFNPARARRGRHGLAGMRFRVEAEHGRFEVTSAPGQGTTVRAWLPQTTAAERTERA